MVINPTHLAQRTRSSINWQDAKRRVIQSYREWIKSAPEIQQMYSLNMPVSALRTKMRQEFERHRYVNQIYVVDMLLFQSHAEFQETLNYWKQLPHILKYFRENEDSVARLPQNFMQCFLENTRDAYKRVRSSVDVLSILYVLANLWGALDIKKNTITE